METGQSTIVEESEIPWKNSRVRGSYRNRRIKDYAIKALAVVAVVAVLYPLLDMVAIFVYKGLTLISISTFTQNIIGTSGHGSGLGLINAITGTLLLIGLSALISIPLGIFGGVYLAEFSGGSRFAEIVRFSSDILAGIPSIVFGYSGYLLLVLYFGWGFSALAAAVTLAVLMLPYILRTTELAIRRVPDAIREGATALGSTKTVIINKLTLRIALPGILTGVLLAVSISLSETAPLLYTAAFSNYSPSALLHSPVGYLTYVVWTYSQFPDQTSHNLAYVASFLLMSFVVVVNLVARVVLNRFSKI